MHAQQRTAGSGDARRGHVTPAAFGALTAALLAIDLVDPVRMEGQLAFLTATLSASAFAWLRVRRLPATIRGPWSWLALAILLSGLGDLIYFVSTMVLHRPEPDISIADPLWLLTYVALGLGLAKMRGKGSFRRDRDAQIDTASTTIVGLLFLWQFVIGPTLGDGATGLTVRLVWASYPLLDLFVLSLLVGVSLTHGRRTRAGVASAPASRAGCSRTSPTWRPPTAVPGSSRGWTPAGSSARLSWAWRPGSCRASGGSPGQGRSPRSGPGPCA